jgi:hypothetical protein
MKEGFKEYNKKIDDIYIIVNKTYKGIPFKKNSITL